MRTQWTRLRAWARELDGPTLARPSVLDGWTVAHLVAHLARAFDALAAAGPTPPGTVPLTLAEYLGTYPERAAEIDRVTRELAAATADDPLGAVDRAAADAFARLAELRRLGEDPVVQARRGPILLSEMLTSRLVELVVHGDDLARSAPRPGTSPLDGDAVRRVSDALLEVVVDRGGWDVEVVDPLAWVRLAAGRVPLTGEALRAALAPTYTSDSLPDLGTALPVL